MVLIQPSIVTPIKGLWWHNTLLTYGQFSGRHKPALSTPFILLLSIMVYTYCCDYLITILIIALIDCHFGIQGLI